MSKKDFKSSINPATMFISASPTVEDKPQTKEEVKAIMPAPKQQNAEPKEETKSKRFNLLLQPSLFEDLTKIATMDKESVSTLIHNALVSYRDTNKDKIDKYNKVFEV